ncbi:hypothetical protein Pla175_28740 [Pirellulimonas nuda]|uniref:Uncharacterized protein n=1 Tax=Pirellulimonas nuda TaxID=2528009 RepID=A0A518DDC5_9BACT|nr:hypothetical protein [Pirellulimonas nuda]QDU89484.1 hypothetical protein Pla175_28740 [Pirellulimonas nuda]
MGRRLNDHDRELAAVRRIRRMLAEGSERAEVLAYYSPRDSRRVRRGLEQIEAELDAIVRNLAAEKPC